MKGKSPTILLSGQATTRMSIEATRETATEGGGILVGRPTQTGFYVHDAIVLADEDAGYAHYTRNGKAAQSALDEYMSDTDDHDLGYIGDWHTHPEPVGPSITDKTTMAVFGRAVSQPILLVVAALGRDQVVQFHATVTSRLPIGIGSRTRVATVKPDDSTRPRRSPNVDT